MNTLVLKEKHFHFLNIVSCLSESPITWSQMFLGVDSAMWPYPTKKALDRIMQYIPHSPTPLHPIWLLLCQYQRHTLPDLQHIFRLLIQIDCLMKNSAPLQDLERQVYFPLVTATQLTLQRPKMIFFMSSEGDCMYGWRTLLQGKAVLQLPLAQGAA